MLTDWEDQFRKKCPHCAAGELVRQRADTLEWVHDWSFGELGLTTGRRVGLGHGICQAHDLRVAQSKGELPSDG